jgi:transposase-like protein
MTKTSRKRNESASQYFDRSTPFGNAGLNLTRIIQEGKAVLDEFQKDLGRKLVESILLMERETVGGTAYHPKPGYKKWSSQQGSVYVGKGKVKVSVPRLRNDDGEVPSAAYESLKNPEAFSEELLDACLSGLSGRRYGEVIDNVGEKFGVSKSSVSRRVREATVQQLRELAERRLDDFDIFAMFLDGVHKAGKVVMAAVGVDSLGAKKVLGLWEGATENAEVCKALLSDLESRGLSLHPNVLFVTDGGSGINSALKARYGKKLLHQRCTAHKKRNLESHLPEEYHAEFRRRYDTAVNMVDYDGAKRELLSVLEWLKGINSSAAKSLEECGERLLTVHRIGVPPELRRILMTTNIIESTFNGMTYAEKNVKRYRNGDMLMRWMASVLLFRERHYRRVDGFKHILKVTEILSEKSFTLAEERLVA